MRYFVTGASGWIGSAVVPELLAAGHQVVGLARSDSSAAALLAAGAEVYRGSLDDPDSLQAGAAASDGVVHLAYNHDFSQMAAAAATDAQSIEAIGRGLEGTGRPLVIAAGTLGLVPPGQVGTERDTPDPSIHPRAINSQTALALAERGVRPLIVRFAPTVHGPGDNGFIATLVGIARDKGIAGYIDDGANRWSAVHRADAARLVRLGLENAPTGSVLHAVGEEGVPTRTIAETIGRRLGVPAQSIPAADAAAHFGWIGMFFGRDCPALSDLTRSLMGWEPTHPGLIDDLEHYYVQATAS